MLERQIQALQSMARSPVGGARDDVVVSVSRQLIEDSLNAVAPWSAEVADDVVVEIRRAEVSLQHGLVLLSLSGRARSPDEEARADLTLHAGIDSVEVSPDSDGLHAHVSLVAFDVAEVDAPRAPRSLSASLVETLGEIGLEAYARLLSGLAIPVSIEESVELPELGPHPVRIAGTRIPVGLRVSGVWAFGDRLWVTLEGRGHPPGGRE